MAKIIHEHARSAATDSRATLLGAAALFATVMGLFLAIQSQLPTLIGWTESFDRGLLAAVNSHARRSQAFDALVWAVSGDYAIQGGVMLAVFCWAWFASPDTPEGLERRQTLLSSMIALYVAVILALVVRDSLAFRLRPASDALVGFQMPYLPAGVTLSRETSSFPSGHATVFFALATGLWWVSPRLGSLGLVHAVVIACLPRVYLGYHFPSDILAGALLSIATVSLVNAALHRLPALAQAVTWSHRRPAAFYAALMLMSVEIATEFASVRTVLQMLSSAHLRRLVMH